MHKAICGNEASIGSGAEEVSGNAFDMGSLTTPSAADSVYWGDDASPEAFTGVIERNQRLTGETGIDI